MPAEPKRFEKKENQQKSKRAAPFRPTTNSAFSVQTGELTQGFGKMALTPTAGPVGPQAGATFAFADALVANAPVAPAVNAMGVAPVRAPVPAVNAAGFAPVPANPTMKLSPGGGRKTRKCKNDATFVWLNIWFKNEFEKLGWIVLARKKGYDEKVNAYINSVERLYHQLGCKIKDTKDHDRKRDLMIMYKDVKYLMDHIHKDF